MAYQVSRASKEMSDKDTVQVRSFPQYFLGYMGPRVHEREDTDRQLLLVYLYSATLDVENPYSAILYHTNVV